MLEYYKTIITDDKLKITREIEMQEISASHGFSPKIIKSIS